MRLLGLAGIFLFFIQHSSGDVTFEEPFESNEETFPGESYSKWKFTDWEMHWTRAFTENKRLHLVAGSSDDPYSAARVSIKSEDCAKLGEFPDEYTVTVDMGGGYGHGVGGYSVALEVGRVCIGFHPGYSRGGVRGSLYARLTQGYGDNFNGAGLGADMGFIPMLDVLYTMKVEVKRITKDGNDYRFNVSVIDTDSTSNKYETGFTVTVPEKLLPIDSICLWRFDGKGGDGLFSNLKVSVP